ncbi:mitochondrial carrier domain-containing protein [Gorgonomyces haynaldii]|nr:mitochondrial carrier domain-containing protein [Gorgonomyces haynaldii]
MKDEEIKPLPVTPTTSFSASSMVGGFVRAFSLQFYQLGSAVLRESIQWWFRVPIKLFRPYSVNPWFFINSMAAADGQPVSTQYIRSLIKRDGWRPLLMNTIPLFILNGLIGTVLFNGYSESLKIFQLLHSDLASFAAGGVGGFLQTLLATPFENFQRSIAPQQVSQHRHRGWHKIGQHAYKSLPSTSLGKLRHLYSGLSVHLVRDSLAFAMFFGVFDNLRDRGKRLVHQSLDTMNIKSKKSQIMLNAGIVVGSGALAGACYQAVNVPLNRISRHLEAKGEAITLWRSVRAVYNNGLRPFYVGMSSQLVRVMPPSALALFVYEVASNGLTD